MAFNLKHILKTLLFSTSEPLSIREIQGVFTRYHEQREKEQEMDPEAGPEQGEIEPIMDQVPSLLTATMIRDAMDTIACELEEAGEVFRLQQGPSGYRLTTAPDFADWVRLLRNETKPARLSQAALETLSIIAYRQPVTRAEMEAIRGVSVDSALNKLLELELAVITGRADLPGRPLQYGTTDKFLEFAGIASVDELPASDVLSSSRISEWILEGSQKQEGLSDRDVGLPDESAPAAAASQSAQGQPISPIHS